jgi:DNA-binding SARP family transcriptional activator
MEFRVLGPVEIRDADRLIGSGHARQRAVLAVLLLELGRVVPPELLIDRIWGDDPPSTVRNVLYGYVARLRAALNSAAEPTATLIRQAGGYRLQADPQQLDLGRFRWLVAEAAAAGPDEQAAALLSEALGLWRGQALNGLDSTWLAAMRTTLELELHAAQLDLNDVRLRLGQHAALVSELTAQSAAARTDERLTGQLMLALYRSGHPAESLRRYEQTRRYLADELGADAGPELQALYQQILAADPALTALRPIAAPVSGTRAMPVPRELPPDVAAFTGRSAELMTLDRLLLPDATGRATMTMAAVISAVSGTAGVGKTALALHWAHHAAAHFPDGQLHVDLRGYDAEQPVSATDALASFLRALGTPGTDIPSAEAERAARYRSLLADKRALILLDNAATVEQVRPLLPGNPDCRVVVTSRDALSGLVARDGARRLDLDLLPLDDAVALLRTLIGASADDSHAAVAELAEQCARLPLALRVAAELAAARPNVPLAGLVAELRDQQQRLNLLHADGDPRTTVRAVFSWSYDHLDHDTARAFRLAGRSPGADFTAYSVAALTGCTLEAAQRRLDGLTRAHLVQPAAPGRYAMHDLLRAYAGQLGAEHDGETDWQDALTSLFDHYLCTASAAMDVLHPEETQSRPGTTQSPSPAPCVSPTDDALRWLEAERANIVALATHAADHGRPDQTIRISRVLWRYLQEAGHLSDELAIYEAASRGARATGDLSAEAHGVTGLGMVSWRQGRLPQAARHFSAALALFSRAGNAGGQARSLHNLAQVEQDQGDYSHAHEHERRALARFREAGETVNEAISLNALGNIAEAFGHYQEAGDCYQESLALCRDHRDRAGQATALANLAIIDERLGQCELSIRHCQQALLLFRQTGHRRGEAEVLRNLGVAEYRLGHYPAAADWLRQALELFSAIADPVGQTNTVNDLGRLLLATGDRTGAQREHTAALRQADEIGYKEGQARGHDGLGYCHQADGAIEQAREHWQQALALFTELGMPEAGNVSRQLAALASAET